MWKQANRAADETFIAIINGKGAVATNGGTVTLDLASIVANITNRLGLPNVSSKLPPSVAHLKILKSKQLKAVQDGVKALKGLDLLLTIIVPLLYALAIFLARGVRRQTLMQVGIAIVLAGLVVFAGRAILVSQVTDSLVKVEANKPAAEAIMSIATSMLSEIAGAFVIVGIPLIAAAWFAGPARIAVKARQRDRSVPARPARMDLWNRRVHHAADLHLEPDPGHRQTGRDHRVPRARLLWNRGPAPPDRDGIPRRRSVRCQLRFGVWDEPERSEDRSCEIGGPRRANHRGRGITQKRKSSR